MLSQISVGQLVTSQRDYFNSGITQDVCFRIQQLQRLKEAIEENREGIISALGADLHKPEFETVLTEIGVCLEEINYALKHIKSWTKPQRVKASLTVQPAKAEIIAEPLGVVLIISPWNYPFQLAISPLIGAIASGNCTIIKPSELSSHTSGLIYKLFKDYFDPEYITVLEGDKEITQSLLTEKFDHIFFTGGTQIGKIIMSAAAKHLTPVTLELGGKSPCIVDQNTHLEYTARRIAWGKFINTGQTCVAPDYILVDAKIKTALVEKIREWVKQMYGDNPAVHPDYGRIVSYKHFERLQSLLANAELVFGGETNADELYIAPTVIENVSWDDAVMEEEIFGPILPIITYENLDSAIAQINSRPKPLALYIFSQDKEFQQQVLQRTSSGGVCINDTIMQLSSNKLPFGGVGDSGMGQYHGKASFATFSHYKSVLNRSFLCDLKLRYPPYQGKLKFLQWLFR